MSVIQLDASLGSPSPRLRMMDSEISVGIRQKTREGHRMHYGSAMVSENYVNNVASDSRRQNSIEMFNYGEVGVLTQQTSRVRDTPNQSNVSNGTQNLLASEKQRNHHALTVQ